MKISVALAAYNGAKFLPQQLESIARQTRLPDELVITDDGSDDETATIVEGFSASAPFHVKWYRNRSRLGPKNNFGRALSLCSGDLIFLCDQDDLWLPEKIETLVDLAVSRPEQACFINDAHMADGDLRPTGTTKAMQIRAAGLPAEAMVMGCCMAIRRDLLDTLLPIPETQRSHDNWLVQMADLLGVTVRLPIPLQYYRRHGGNVSGYFVNRIDRPGFSERLLGALRNLSRRATRGDGLAGEIVDLQDAMARLMSRQDSLRAILGEEAFYSVRDRVSDRLQRLCARRDIRALTPVRRWGPFCSLWRAGGYRRPGDWKAALKDLTISKTPLNKRLP